MPLLFPGRARKPRRGILRGTKLQLRRLRLENATLRAQLSAVSSAPARRCDGCGAEDIVAGRACESRRVYCEACWRRWERSGRWRPEMRVSLAPPSGSPPAPEESFFISEFICKHHDFSLLENLRSELPSGEAVLPCECHGFFSGKALSFGSGWWVHFDNEADRLGGPRHIGMQFEGPSDMAELRSTTAPPTLRGLVLKLELAFGIVASAARLNLYQAESDFKQLHSDRGRDSSGVPQLTVGVSLGSTRELSFSHWRTGITTSFYQKNGDVFAFTPELNRIFLHGVPLDDRPDDELKPGMRLSLILWGARVDE